MRNAFCQSLVEAASRPDFVFLTGDLGYKALEPLREAMGSRFINAGVAEQNMVSVAAGLARSGLRPWVYSIAPFVYARPFEQIRNDVCLHKLPVVLVGNGGGYGYGVMGATHHALEDYGALLCLPHIRAYVPAFDADVTAMTSDLFSVGAPGLLPAGALRGAEGCDRSALCSLAQAPGWSRLGDPGDRFPGRRPLGGRARPRTRPVGPRSGCSASFPYGNFPRNSWPTWPDPGACSSSRSMSRTAEWPRAWRRCLLESGEAPERFASRSAQGYLSGRYGSQKFHRRECGLDPASIVDFLATQDS